MMSLQAFADRCGYLIKQHTPFIAYRHDRGCALLILEGDVYAVRYKYIDKKGKPRYTTDFDRVRGTIVDTKAVHKTPMVATVTGFRRAIAKMQKDPRTRGSLCTVESDGNDYSIECDSLAELIEAMGV